MAFSIVVMLGARAVVTIDLAGVATNSQAEGSGTKFSAFLELEVCLLRRYRCA